jgi:hypothetical protein
MLVSLYEVALVLEMSVMSALVAEATAERQWTRDDGCLRGVAIGSITNPLKLLRQLQQAYCRRLSECE